MTSLARYVTISSKAPRLSVTALRGDAPPAVTGGYGGWQIVARPRRVGLTEWQGRDPYQLDLPLLLDGYADDSSVEVDISRLERMALPPAPGKEPPQVTVRGALHDVAVPHHDLTWVINGLDQGDALFSLAHGYRVRQAVTVKLVSYSAADRVADGTAASRARQKAQT